MYEPSGGSGAKPERPGGEERPSAKSVPNIIWRISTPFGRRHTHGIAVIRFLVAIWLVCLGSIYCGFGYWWGAFLFVGAGLVGWLAYEMPRWKEALDAQSNGPRPR